MPVMYHEPIKATAPGRVREQSRYRTVCARCGIETSCRPSKKTAYCDDCLPEARNLGWVPRATTPKTKPGKGAAGNAKETEAA